MNPKNRIRELRQREGWRQDDLAARLNTKRQTIGHYETGERGIDADTICQLCEIFGCTADFLLGRSASPYRGFDGCGHFSAANNLHAFSV